jgi:pyruvate formate-lyase activating enzyme-like uncharacterized protein
MAESRRVEATRAGVVRWIEAMTRNQRLKKRHLDNVARGSVNCRCGSRLTPEGNCPKGCAYPTLSKEAVGK